MFNSFTEKIKSFIFSPLAVNSRKRKRPLDESNDSDCEIVEVKRAKNNVEGSQLEYSFVEKMADWVRDKTKWHKMFDFRPKPETSKRNGRLQQEVRGQSSHGYQQDRSVKHNGNGMSSQNSRGQGQTFVKGQRRGENGPGVVSYSSNTEETGRQQRSGDPTIYGDGRETPPDDRIQGQLNVMQQVGRRTYAAVVKSSRTAQQAEDNYHNATVSNSTQTHGGDSKVSNGSQSNSIQKVLFDKKPEFHSTQMNQANRKTYASVIEPSTTRAQERGDNYHNTAVSNSTQTYGDTFVFKGNQNDSRQKSLFGKKPEFHSTANNMIRLAEKEKYKMLLQKFTRVPLRPLQTDNNRTEEGWSPRESSRYQREGETLQGKRTDKHVTKIYYSHSKDIPPPRSRVTPKYVQPSAETTMLHRHISPPSDFSSSNSNSTVQSPTSIPECPLLESTRVIESRQEKTVPHEQTSLFDRNKSHPRSTCDYRASPYLSENWASDLKSKYSSQARDKARKIDEAEVRVKLYEERRKGRDENLERRLRQQMRIYETEPAVVEDIEESEEEEEKEEEFPEITDEMDDVINRSLQGHPSGEVLVEAYRLQITRGDIATLAGLNWLNDEVINFYMNMLMERGEKDNHPKCYAFNTFFYPKIMSGGHSTVRRWTKKVDIFSYDYIIIPVHLGMHWCLCIVDFKKKSIQYYDSMGGNNLKCLNAVKQYLCDECKDKKNQQFDLNGWSTEIVEDIPQQMNGSDCGMFACKYADYITRGAKITFTQQHMSYFRRRMVYEIVKKTLLQ